MNITKVDSNSNPSFGSLRFTPEASDLLASRISRLPSSMKGKAQNLLQRLTQEQLSNENDIFFSTVGDASSGLKFLVAKFKHPTSGKEVYMDEHLFSSGVKLVQKACEKEHNLKLGITKLKSLLKSISEDIVRTYSQLYKFD